MSTLSVTNITTANATTDLTIKTGNTSNPAISLYSGTGILNIPVASFTTALETVNVAATAATGTMSYYVSNQTVLYYTANATANFNPNVAWSSTSTLNSVMANGQAISVTWLVTQGTTAYFSNTIYIDGTQVTPKWQGGSTPTAGNASGVDGYVYTIIKTGSATYTVLASQTQFK